MKKLIFIILLLSGSFLTFFSCVNLDTEKQSLPDAYVCSKIVNGDTLYILGGYVNSNSTMKSVIMESTDGSVSDSLTKLDYNGYYFERTLNEGNYKLQKPVKGYYNFEIVYGDGTICDTTDYVSADILTPIKITEVKTDSVAQLITVNWEKNSKASYFIVKFFRNDSLVFISNGISSSYSSMMVYTYSSGWNSNIPLKSGDSLDVVISGVLNESGDSQYSEIQSVSFSLPVGLVWPE
jgi:hypothetical protein